MEFMELFWNMFKVILAFCIFVGMALGLRSLYLSTQPKPPSQVAAPAAQTQASAPGAANVEMSVAAKSP